MRYILNALLVGISPVIANAEPLMIAPERILGVHLANEYAGNDWNRDDYSDLTVLAISEAGDEVDLYLATSDPETGNLAITEIAYGILPYDPRRVADVHYYIYPSNETSDPIIGYATMQKQTALSIRIDAKQSGSQIMDIMTTTSNGPGLASDINCEIWFLNIFEDNFVPYATIASPDGPEIKYQPENVPKIAAWHYTELPSPCLP